VELPIVQILVIVAIIEVRSFKAEEGKGFMRRAIRHEWRGPKPFLNRF